MAKIVKIEISCCYQCPNCIFGSMSLKNTGFCRQGDRVNTLHNKIANIYDGIPAWCPLPDAPKAVKPSTFSDFPKVTIRDDSSDHQWDMT